MDVEIVDEILRRIVDEKIFIFEICRLVENFQEKSKRNERFVLASVKNFPEIFKIHRDRNQIEFEPSFENFFSTSDVEFCSEFFLLNSCKNFSSCTKIHRYDEKLLGNVVQLDLKILFEVFSIFSQEKFSTIRNDSKKFSIDLDPKKSWKSNEVFPQKKSFVENFLQVHWEPDEKIEKHFIPIIFGNEKRFNAGPIERFHIFQHFRFANIFYRNPKIIEQIVDQGPIVFHSFVFKTFRAERVREKQKFLLKNLPNDSEQIEFFIRKIFSPWEKSRWNFYENNRNIVLVEFDEQIHFSKIIAKIQKSPFCGTSLVEFDFLYAPRTIFVENFCSENFSNSEKFVVQKFDDRSAFLHFRSENELIEMEKNLAENSGRTKKIHVEIFNEKDFEPIDSSEKIEDSVPIDSSEKIEDSVPIGSSEKIEDSAPIGSSEKIHLTEDSGKIEASDEIESPDEISSEISSGDDFGDFPPDFDDDRISFESLQQHDEFFDFMNDSTRNLIRSIGRTEDEPEPETEKTEKSSPPLVYSDDCSVHTRNRNFSVAFLDYLQYRIEKHRNVERLEILRSLKKDKNEKKLKQ